VEEPHGQTKQRLGGRLTAAQLSNYHGDAAELNLVEIVDFAVLRHTAMSARADDTLVSRIMSTSFAAEIEVCGDCAVGYGDRHPLVVGARRCGSDC
jgi:hypothetical protein